MKNEVGVDRLQVVDVASAVEDLRARGVDVEAVLDDEIILRGLDNPEKLKAAQEWANENGFEREQCGDVYTTLWPAE